MYHLRNEGNFLKFIEVSITSGQSELKPKGFHVNFDPMLFKHQRMLNKLPSLLIFILFSIHDLTKKSGLRTRTETRKQLHTVLPINSGTVSMKYKQHYIPIVNYIFFSSVNAVRT